MVRGCHISVYCSLFLFHAVAECAGRAPADLVDQFGGRGVFDVHPRAVTGLVNGGQGADTETRMDALPGCPDNDQFDVAIFMLVPLGTPTGL